MDLSQWSQDAPNPQQFENISFKIDDVGRTAKITLFDFGFGYFLNKNDSFDKIYDIVVDVITFSIIILM